MHTWELIKFERACLYATLIVHVYNVKLITFPAIYILGILLVLVSILQMWLLCTARLMDFLLSRWDMTW